MIRDEHKLIVGKHLIDYAELKDFDFCKVLNVIKPDSLLYQLELTNIIVVGKNYKKKIIKKDIPVYFTDFTGGFHYESVYEIEGDLGYCQDKRGCGNINIEGYYFIPR